MRKLLPAFSYLFHPIFIGLYAFLLFSSQNYVFFSFQELYLLLIKISLFTLVIPLIAFYILLHFKKIDTIMVKNVSHRKLPLLIQCLLVIILVVYITEDRRLIPLQYYFFGTLLSSILALIFVFFRKKISLHMLGINSLTCFYFALSISNNTKNLQFFTLLIILNGLVGSSRIAMKAHTLQELLLGSVIGFIPQLFLLVFWL